MAFAADGDCGSGRSGNVRGGLSPQVSPQSSAETSAAVGDNQRASVTRLRFTSR
jgi:hypothetical protein